MKVCVVALGKIGLPLAAQIASRGHEVIGADIAPGVVDGINAGVAPFDEPGLDERLRAAVDGGLLRATTDTTAAVGECDAVIIVVPLVVDDNDQPDFRAMDAATAAVGAGLTANTLVSYETTLPIHTTRERFIPALEEASGLTVGTDLFLCHSPERVSSGTVFVDLRKYPKLVGGVDVASAARATELYEAILEFDERPDLGRPNGVWDLGSAEAAEFAKLAETTYRDVNIGLANEFARYADTLGVDIDQVITASNSQPFSHIHRPGVAVGGHCIPVYPRLYLSTDPAATIPRTARAANNEMPGYALDRLSEMIGGLDGRRIGVFGVAYRGGVKEPAFSGAFPLRDDLAARGATPLAADPMFTDDELVEMGFAVWDGSTPLDGVVVQADHAEYRSFSAADLGGATAVLDGRRVLDVDALEAEGVKVVRIGAGDSTT